MGKRWPLLRTTQRQWRWDKMWLWGEREREMGANFPKAAPWQGGQEESVLLEPPSRGSMARNIKFLNCQLV